MAKPSKTRRRSKADIKAAAERAEARSKGETPEEPKVDIDPLIAVADVIREKMGRPTKYRPEYAAVAKALCRRGATDHDLAQEFGVTTVTIWNWSCQHEDFFNALKVDKDQFDEKIVRSLAQRAAGYSYNTQKVFNFQGTIVRAEVVEHVPPDVGAAKLWLSNRRPKEWREPVQRHEHGGAGDFDNMTDAELRARIEQDYQMLEAMKFAAVNGKQPH